MENKKSLERKTQALLDMDTIPIHLSVEEKMHRVDLLKAISKCKMLLNSLDDMKPFLDEYTQDGLRVGYAQDLTRNFASATLDSILLEIG